MLAPDVSFVLHTADPLAGTAGERDSSRVYAEVAPGLGETLASGTEGSAWRMSLAKADGAVTVHSFANFAEAYLPVRGAQAANPPGTSIYGSTAVGSGVQPGMVAKMTVDYSKQELSRSEDARLQLGQGLAKVGAAMETAFGAAQDVEGAVVDGAIYVVQSRPQP